MNTVTKSIIITESIVPSAEAGLLVEPAAPIVPMRKLYFINEQVEWACVKYIWTGCTEIKLRDEIMSHASELIRQIIRKQGLHTIYPGHEESSFGDLLNTAYVQLERVLYKFRSRPHCRNCYNPDRPSDSLLYIPGDLEYGVKHISEIVKMHKNCPKCGIKLTTELTVDAKQGTYGGSDTILYRGMSKIFNMWSQVSRTVILAYIKREGRDRKNSTSYVSHLGNKSKPISDVITRFLIEAKDICHYNDDYIKIIDSLEWLIYNDDRPHDGMIGKLVEKSGLSRVTVASFMRQVKLRSFEFTDSPLNKKPETKVEQRRMSSVEIEEE